MELDRNLLKEFAQITNDSEVKTKHTYLRGTIVNNSGGKYVRLDGSTTVTPISGIVDVEEGDRVLVSIENHKATIIGNFSFPPSARKEQEAIEKAETAKDTADAAQNTANTANNTANTANNTANAANEAATAAQQKAQEANANAEEAIDKANIASESASEAKEQATDAVSKANTASTSASEAKELATQANTKSTEAKNLAAESQASSAAAQAEVTKLQNEVTTAKENIDAALDDLADQANEIVAIKENYSTKVEMGETKASLETEISKKVGELQTTIEKDYSTKTENIALEGKLQSQITQNAEGLASQVSKIEKLEGDTTQAQKDVADALSKASAAQTAATTAQGIANAAQSAADTASANASAAADKATLAKNAADAANAAATAADQAVQKAQGDLSEAKENLANVTSRVGATEADIAEAQSKVDKAQKDVDDALANAAEANVAATKAQSAADKAQQDAETAQGVANTAQQKADNAKTAADNAQAAADQAQKDVAALTKRVTTAETNIKQNSDEIELNAKKTEEIGEDLLNLGSTKTEEGQDLTIDASNNPVKIYCHGNTIQKTRNGINQLMSFKEGDTSYFYAITNTYTSDTNYYKSVPLADNWIHMECDLTGLSSGQKYLNCFIGPKRLPNLKTSTNYTVVIEFRNTKITKMSGSFNLLNTHDTNADDYFSGSWNLSSTNIKDGSMYKKLVTTRNTFSGGIALRNFHTLNAGDKFSYDYRMSVLEGDYTNTGYTYEEFGKAPTPEFPSDIENVGNNINLCGETPILESTTRVKYVLTNIESNERYTLSSINLPSNIDIAVRNLYNDSSTNKILWKKSGTFVTESNTTALEIVFAKGTNHNETISVEDLKDCSVKLEKGSIETPYSPYNCGSVGLKIENANLYKGKTFTQNIRGVNCIFSEESTLQMNGTATSNGGRTNTSDLSIRTLKKGKKYTLYVEKISGTGTTSGIYLTKVSDGSSYRLCNDNKASSFYVSEDVDVYFGVNVLVDAVFNNLLLRIGLYEGEYTFDEIKNMFAIHEEKIISFPLSEGQLLHKGDYLADDGIHQMRKTIILNGTEIWYYSAERNNFSTDSSKIRDIATEKVFNPNAKNIIISNYFQGSIWYNLYNKLIDNAISGHDTGKVINIRTTQFTSLDDFKSWLAEQYANGTPVTIEYKLAEEIIVPYTPEQQYVFNNIKTFKGINYIYCVNETIPEKIIVRYYPNTPYNETLINKDDLTNNYYNKTETESLIKVEADKITLATGKIETVEKNFNNLQIGGRNLLKNSSMYEILGSDHSSKTTREKGKITLLENLTNSSANAWFFLGDYYTTPVSELTKNNKYLVFSVDVKVTGLTTGLVRATLDVRGGNASNPIVSTKGEIEYGKNYKEGEWVRLTNMVINTNNVMCGNSVIVFHFVNANKGAVLEYRNFKVEVGNKSTSWTPAPEDVDSSVDTKLNNLQIGGRNLLIGTSTNKSLSINKPTSYTSFDVYRTNNKTTLKDLGFKSGDEITLSFNWEMSQNGELDFVYGNFRAEFIGIKSGTDNSYLGAIKNPIAAFSSTNTSGKAIVTKALTDTTVNTHTIRIRIDNSVLVLNVSKMKLEKGNKATDWTPAPEDVESNINNVQNNLNNLQIGGTNLLRGTRTQDGILGNYINGATKTTNIFKTCSVFKSSIAWNDIGFNFKTQIIDRNLVKVGDKVTYSIYAKTDDTADIKIQFFASKHTADDQHYIYGDKISLTNEWKRYSHTFVITSAMLNTSSLYLNAVRFEPTTACTSGKYVYWAAPKFELGEKATDWTPAPEDTESDINDVKNDLANNYYTKTQTISKSEFQVETNRITSTVERVDCIVASNSLSNAKSLYKDTVFQSGVNSCYVYNNSDNGAVTVTRQAKSTDNPYPDAQYELMVKTTAAANPGWGGIQQSIKSRANAVFVRRLVAKIPSGYTIHPAENSMGTDYKVRWLTPNKGTGKFEVYMYMYTCGATGTFSTGGHMCIKGGTTPTTDNPLIWYVASCETYDATSIPINIDELASSSDLESATKNLDDRIKEQKTAIDQLSNMIAQLVTDENGESLMTQTSDGWTFNMSSIQGSLSSLQKAITDVNGANTSTSDALTKLTKLVNDIDKKTAYITIGTDDNGDPCIELGKSNNNFKVRITNTAIDFLEGSTRIAYANNNTFYAEKMIVKNELQIGTGPGFVWRTRPNGNMGLVYISS